MDAFGVGVWRFDSVSTGLVLELYIFLSTDGLTSQLACFFFVFTWYVRKADAFLIFVRPPHQGL